MPSGDPAPRPRSGAYAYLITFACYGKRLHGDPLGSVDRDHNVPGTPLLPADPIRYASESRLMREPPYGLDPDARRIVLETIQRVCIDNRWTLYAAHVRLDHVHIVVSTQKPPEKALGYFKLCELVGRLRRT